MDVFSCNIDNEMLDTSCNSQLYIYIKQIRHFDVFCVYIVVNIYKHILMTSSSLDELLLICSWFVATLLRSLWFTAWRFTDKIVA